MSAFYWYEPVPTVMSSGGTVTYIWPTDDMLADLAKTAAEWVHRAESRGEPITVVTRAAVESMLAGVDEKAVTAAKLKPETTDVSAPLSGTSEAKEAAVAEKLSTILSIAEWEKLTALAATVEAKPVEPVDERK